MKIVILITLGCCILVGANLVQRDSSSNKLHGTAPARQSLQSERCWFTGPKGFENVNRAVIEDRQNRELFGYPEEIPISQALRVFNDEQKCFRSYLSDLTEDEVLSALAVPGDYGTESQHNLQRETIQKILLMRSLPKGALLVNEGAGTYQSPISGTGGEIKVQGQRIYLFLDLHEHPRDSALENEQIILIKKSFFGLEGL